MPIKKPLEERLWSKIKKGNPNDCWEWIAGCQGDGYGTIGIGKKQNLAHRIVYELANGYIDHKLCVMHKCDNRRCCNPDHLIQGTIGENNRDRHRKGRTKPPKTKRGEMHPMAKLTEQDVLKIYAATGTLSAIGKRFGVSFQTVSQIKNKKRWRFLTKEICNGKTPSK